MNDFMKLLTKQQQ